MCIVAVHHGAHAHHSVQSDKETACAVSSYLARVSATLSQCYTCQCLAALTTCALCKKNQRV